jgi:hypothetical protein
LLANIILGWQWQTLGSNYGRKRLDRTGPIIECYDAFIITNEETKYITIFVPGKPLAVKSVWPDERVFVQKCALYN